MKVLFGPAKSQTLDSPILIELHRYWDRKRGARLFPSRAQIKPDEIKSCLPHVVLTDVLCEPLRFRYRLVGTAVTELAGVGELTGRFIDEEIFGGFANPVLALYRTVVEDRRPARGYGQIRQLRGREWVTLEDIFLPLGDTDDAVTMVMVGVTSQRTAASKRQSGDDPPAGSAPTVE